MRGKTNGKNMNKQQEIMINCPLIVPTNCMFVWFFISLRLIEDISTQVLDTWNCFYASGFKCILVQSGLISKLILLFSLFPFMDLFFIVDVRTIKSINVNSINNSRVVVVDRHMHKIGNQLFEKIAKIISNQSCLCATVFFFVFWCQ